MTPAATDEINEIIKLHIMFPLLVFKHKTKEV